MLITVTKHYSQNIDVDLKELKAACYCRLHALSTPGRQNTEPSFRFSSHVAVALSLLCLIISLSPALVSVSLCLI